MKLRFGLLALTLTACTCVPADPAAIPLFREMTVYFSYPTSPRAPCMTNDRFKSLARTVTKSSEAAYMSGAYLYLKSVPPTEKVTFEAVCTAPTLIAEFVTRPDGETITFVIHGNMLVSSESDLAATVDWDFIKRFQFHEQQVVQAISR